MNIQSTQIPLEEEVRSRRRRWSALLVLCTGMLMVVVDSTIVNVALPSIRTDLRFTDASLAWVVNAYVFTFGGSLLLAGRLGDLYGHRKVFLIGIVLFTIASLACGVATTRDLLVAARAVQGLGGAAVVAVALSLISNMFSSGIERPRAVGAYGFVYAAGSTVGLLLGGVLTSALDWHWIFIANVPVGVAAAVLGTTLIPEIREKAARRPLDIPGAVTLIAAMVLAICALVNGTLRTGGPVRSAALLLGAAALLALFLAIETRAPAPLIPLRIFSLRAFTISNVVRFLWAAGISPWFFTSTLYMQLVLGHGPMQVGLAFLPANLIIGIFSLSLSARLVMRFGTRATLLSGLVCAASGLAVLTQIPADGSVASHLMPGMILLALGAGLAYTPLILTALADVPASESGLASGVLNTASMMGSALGLAVIAALSAARSENLLSSGVPMPLALVSGYQLTFLVGVGCVGAAALITAVFLGENPRRVALGAEDR